jgi:flagellar biosynthetic protein FlhB
MADEETDKESQTEEATEKRIRSALEEGNVPVSREASILASIAAALLVAVFVLTNGVARIVTALTRLIDNAGEWRIGNGADAILLFRALLEQVGSFFVPVFLIFIVAGLATSAAQNAPSLVLGRIQPRLSKLSISNGFSRLFGRQGQIEFAKGIFKFAAISLVVFTLVRSEKDNFYNAMIMEPSELPPLMLTMAIHLLSAICTATVILVGADLVWVRIRWRSDLRMSKREIKEEMKQNEGDPLLKARRRSLALDRSRRRMIAAVPRATVVIANPTHYAVALRYVREEGGAPLVVAKGQDLIALKIREIAEANDIPVIEDKVLARSMYQSVEVDRMIPPQFYRAVAEVIHYLHAKAPRKARTR